MANELYVLNTSAIWKLRIISLCKSLTWILKRKLASNLLRDWCVWISILMYVDVYGLHINDNNTNGDIWTKFEKKDSNLIEWKFLQKLKFCCLIVCSWGMEIFSTNLFIHTPIHLINSNHVSCAGVGTGCNR